MIYAASDPVHLDSAIYPNADQFGGFRFERLTDQDSDDKDVDLRYQLVATSADYLAWGHGKHACPGRFFAAAELKMILGYLILNYDLRFEQPGVRPSATGIEEGIYIFMSVSSWRHLLHSW